MVISCSAYGCKNKWSKESPVHFHKFPLKFKKLCEKWISALMRKHFTPTRASLVCSDHFTEEDYKCRRGTRRIRLRRNAVPSIFNFPVVENLPLPVDFASFNELSPSPYKTISKKQRGKKPKLKRKSKKTDNDDFTIIDCVIDELDVYENVETKSTSKSNDIHVYDNVETKSAPKTNDTLMCVEEDIEEIEDLNSGVEEDQCGVLGNMWGERLKQLPLDVRPVVRQLIDQIFEEATMDVVTEKLSVEDL